MSDLFSHAQQQDRAKAKRPSQSFAARAAAMPRKANSSLADLVQQRDRPDPRLHVCGVCGGAGIFGFDCFWPPRESERWACAEHRDQVKGLS